MSENGCLIYACHIHGGQTRKKTTISLGGS